MAYNTKCDPLNNNVNVPTLPPIPAIPGFAPDLNFLNDLIPFISGFPQNIVDLINRLKFTLPGGGQLKDIANDLEKKISAIISNILSYLNIFLGFYYFILAIIELILCIINVMCGIPNVWSMIRRVKKLIRKCIPLFLEICAPFFVLLALIMALIALLLALIEYIIATIKRLIDQLLKNIKRLKYILQQGNSDAAYSIVSKVSNLLCLFEHIFVLLGAIDTVIELIKTKWDTILKVCNTGGSSGDTGNDSCCNPVCTNFLSNPESQINDPLEIWNSRVKSNVGNLTYMSAVYGSPYPSLFSSMIVPIRNEQIYLSDDLLDDTLKFKNILSSVGANNLNFPFFPANVKIDATTDRRKIPYFVDVTLGYNPNDGYGYRNITVTDCVVTNVILNPQLIVINGSIVSLNGADGYLVLDGGTYHDGYNNKNYTLLQILRDKSGLNPTSNGNGTYYANPYIKYQLKINYDSLLDYMLITLDCLPSMKVEYNHLSLVSNKAFSSLANLIKFPDVAGAINKMQNALNAYRNNINEDTTLQLQDSLNKTINDLNDQTNNTLGQILDSSIDAYNTNKSLFPEVQFVTDKITVKLTPRMNNNLTLQDMLGSVNIDNVINSTLSSKFTGNASLGKLSNFVYDGYGNFTAELTSEDSGNGTLSLFYNGIPIVSVNSPDDLDIKPSIDNSPLTYTFVGFTKDKSISRRDESDVSTNKA